MTCDLILVEVKFKKIEVSAVRYNLARPLSCSPYTVCLQMNGVVSKVNKEFISHLTRAKRTPLAAATVQVSHALPAVR